ncbi:hypothetical protein CK203_094433 [Vitis vinifera]|uniref:Reverse transcriptase domain-containing protein n=1 Tax=Vitis vinifera TaxID=29760 RepID=A0A438CKW2_VITVI|nr:hypothetical protein CK203_094433 [Vitis vinifera]
MEAFSRLIAKAKEGGFIKGVKIEGRGEERVQVSHLLLANDTLLFCEDDEDQLEYWKWIANCFELVLGLKINLQKSEIIPIGGMEDVDKAIVLFGCKVGRFPTSYLGLPLRAPHRSIGVWDVTEERFKSKLAAWKKQYLSKAGRLVLIKSTLSSLPIYFMSNVGQP